MMSTEQWPLSRVQLRESIQYILQHLQAVQHLEALQTPQTHSVLSTILVIIKNMLASLHPPNYKFLDTVLFHLCTLLPNKIPGMQC